MIVPVLCVSAYRTLCRCLCVFFSLKHSFVIYLELAGLPVSIPLFISFRILVPLFGSLFFLFWLTFPFSVSVCLSLPVSLFISHAHTHSLNDLSIYFSIFLLLSSVPLYLPLSLSLSHCLFLSPSSTSSSSRVTVYSLITLHSLVDLPLQSSSSVL